MKKIFVCVIMLTVVTTSAIKAQDPITVIIKQGIKKVIVAVDLKIQRLQTKTIWLQNAQKKIENSMSKLKLGQITDWVQKQKDLYQDYFDELWKVKDVITYYNRIKDIMQQQVSLVKEYRYGWKGIAGDKHFTPDELEYIGKVYSGIINASIRNLDQVTLVINSFNTQMSDAKRIEIINSAADKIQANLNDLRSFNSQNIMLSLQRSKDESDIASVKEMYGLK